MSGTGAPQLPLGRALRTSVSCPPGMRTFGKIATAAGLLALLALSARAAGGVYAAKPDWWDGAAPKAPPANTAPQSTPTNPSETKVV